MAREHVFPIAEPSFFDRRTFGVQDTGSSGVYLRKFSEQIVGEGTDSLGNSFNHFVVAWNKDDNDDHFLKNIPSLLDGLKVSEIEIPAGFVVCIGSKDPGSPYSFKNPVTLPGHPSDAFSIPGTEYFTSNRLNRLAIDDKQWVTIMWVGTRWVWMGSSNWV